jgi:branched-chain amino acid transport system permease protein
MRRLPMPILAYFVVMAALPLFMGTTGLFYDAFQAIFVFSLVGLGLNVVTGFTGLLNLGMAAFMAIGAYTFAILTSDIYPFQIGFWWGILATVAIGAVAGFLLGAPTLGLSGDYLAIVTMGFGEITLDVLKNLDAVTKGTQGINPLPRPTFGPWTLELQQERGWYWLLLGFVLLAVLAVRRLERSRSGRAWLSIREDALASQCMGIPPKRTKMIAFATGSALAALGGALFAALLSSTGEPASYDFQVSILALCIVIVGGMGSVAGTLVGAVVMVGMNSLVLVKLADWAGAAGVGNASNVLASPNNWKYLIFGLALILVVRLKPDGLLPPRLEGGSS